MACHSVCIWIIILLMGAKKQHEVPPYQVIDARLMADWIRSKVLSTVCQRASHYSFKAQPATMCGQRRTLYPFLKFYLSGSSQIQNEEGEVVMEAQRGDLTVFAAETCANVQFTGPISFFRVTMLPEETFLAFNFIARIAPGDFGPREEQVMAYVLKEPPSRLIRELLTRLESWPAQEDRASVWRLMLREWCGSLSKQISKTSDSAEIRLRTRRSEVMDYLEANAHRLINRQSVAEALGISPGELSRLFQRTGEESFTETLNRIRLEHAKNWLRRDGMSVADVAARCGFSSANYFAQVFRRAEGVGPQAWRRL